MIPPERSRDLAGHTLRRCARSRKPMKRSSARRCIVHRRRRRAVGDADKQSSRSCSALVFHHRFARGRPAPASTNLGRLRGERLHQGRQPIRFSILALCLFPLHPACSKTEAATVPESNNAGSWSQLPSSRMSSAPAVRPPKSTRAITSRSAPWSEDISRDQRQGRPGGQARRRDVQDRARALPAILDTESGRG